MSFLDFFCITKNFYLTIERYNIVTNRIDLDEINTSIKNLILSQIMYNDIIGIRFMDWRKQQ